MYWDCNSPYKSGVYNPNTFEGNGLGSAEMTLNWEKIIIQNSGTDLEGKKTIKQFSLGW